MALREWRVQLYEEQKEAFWPSKGRHILAQYDDNCVVVYQAFSPKIAEYAVVNQRSVLLRVHRYNQNQC